MTWVHRAVRDNEQRAAYTGVHDLADWSDWLPFELARPGAPREPGVYLLREPDSGVIRYAGMAGERAGSGQPQGLYGRLSVYWTGKGAVSGFGEAALDRVLADPDWVAQQLHHLRAHGPKRAKDWARDAVLRLGLEVSWAVSADRTDAKYLEDQTVAMLRQHDIWNR
jgi:hypothetical protein